MQEYDLILLSLLVFSPAAFALGLLALPRKATEAMKWWALFGTSTAFVLSTFVFIDYYALFDSTSDRTQRAAITSLEARADRAAAAAARLDPRDGSDLFGRFPWIDRFQIDYVVGVDGISLPLVLLSTVLCFLAVLASWKQETNVRGYLMLILLLETGVLGAFVALDLFLFYVFYELMLVPMYLLIGIWGGARRELAAIKFVLYTLGGSLLILVALIALYFTDVADFAAPGPQAIQAEAMRRADPTLSESEAQAKVVVHTFDMLTLHKAGRAARQVLHGHAEESGATRTDQAFFTPTFQYTVFLLLAIGFAVKLPVVPLHTWLPDAHVEAPTPVSMLLAGLLLKLGGYGLIRIAWPICPWAAEQLAWSIGLFACINIVYGALVAMGQTDFKKLLAYSSVSHMGYVLLGLAVWAGAERSQYWSWALTGALFQMIAHGITSAAMFFIVGVIYDRAHHRDLNRFRGLMEPMPIYGGHSAVLFLASMGVPGLCGFVGELLVLLGTWNFSPAFAIAGAVTVILTAAYLLWTFQRVFLGTNPETQAYPDLTMRELLILLPLAVLAILLGVMPNLFLLHWMEPSVSGLVSSLTAGP